MTDQETTIIWIHELERLEQDAARYHFIRQKQVHGYVPIVGGWLSEEAFDESIDRLMKE